MTENTELEPVEAGNFRVRILALGAIVGALTGVGAAYLLLQKADDEGLKLTPGEGVKLGISVFTLFRQIVNLGN